MEESQQLHLSVRHNYNGNGNNNKPLNVSGHDGSGQLADSGYTSYHSIVGMVLDTIEEDNEADISFEEARASVDIPQMTSNILTPSTAASIQISNFHLTTPNSAGKQVEKRRNLVRKPTCENLFEQHTPKKAVDAGFFGTKGTPLRLERKSELGILTPRKNKESAKRKFGQFREKLYSDGDARQHTASGELDDSLEEACKKLDKGGDISPIFHNKRRRNSDIDDLIRSSTPKTASVRSNFHVEGRENIDWEAVNQGKALGPMRKPLRKFLSLSPSKMHSYRKRDSILQEKSVITNHRAPLKRQNALRETSLKQDSATFSTPRKSQECSTEESFELSPGIPMTPQKQANFGALLDAPILVQTSAEPDFKEADLDQEVSQIPSFDDRSCPVSPGTQTLPSEDSCVIRDASVNIVAHIPSILESESHLLGSLITPKTPTSANKSRNRVKRLSSIKKDKPRSKPPSPIHRAPPVILGSYRPSYAGVERLNILKRLNKLDKDSLGIILDYLTDSDLVRVVAVSRGWRRIIEEHRRTYRRLRDYLAREAHGKENLDRTGGSASISSRDSSLLWKTASVVSFDGGKESSAVSIQRHPFSLCNSIDGNQSAGELRRLGSVQKSPPVSPSKRKFRENQKIASHLKRSERLKPCPRCEKPSRVMLTKSSIKQALATGSLDSSTTVLTVAGGKLEKSYTLPEPSIGCTAANSTTIMDSSASPTNNSDRIRRNLFSTSLLPRSQSVDVQTPVARTPRRRSSTDALGFSASLLERKLTTKNGKSTYAEGNQCDYAVCSGKGCGFMFCIKCLCEYHPNSVCKDLAPNSPSKEDVPALNVACSKQSRRSLQRLRK